MTETDEKLKKSWERWVLIDTLVNVAYGLSIINRLDCCSEISDPVQQDIARSAVNTALQDVLGRVVELNQYAEPGLDP